MLMNPSILITMNKGFKQLSKQNKLLKETENEWDEDGNEDMFIPFRLLSNRVNLC